MARSLKMPGFRYFAFPMVPMPEPVAVPAEPVALAAAPDAQPDAHPLLAMTGGVVEVPELAATIAAALGAAEPTPQVRRAAPSATAGSASAAFAKGGGAGPLRAYALLADIAARPGPARPAAAAPSGARAPARAVRLRMPVDLGPARG